MEWSAWSAHKKHVLCIAGLYAPAVATCDILSSRTAQFEIQKRIRTDSAFYIINLYSDETAGEQGLHRDVGRATSVWAVWVQRSQARWCTDV